MQQLIFVLVLFTVIQSKVAKAQPLFEDYAEVAYIYVSGCAAIEYLKKSYCPRQAVQNNMQSCFELTVQKLKQPYRNEFRRSLGDYLSRLNAGAIEGVDKGYKTTLNMANGDQQKACELYGVSLATYNQAKLEELNRLALKIR